MGKHLNRAKAYFGTDTRAQALLIGAAAAALLVGDWPALTAGWSVVRTRRGRMLAWLLPLAGLALLGVAAHRATGSAAEFRGGLRVTTPEAMEVVRMVLMGQVGRELVGLLNAHGPLAVGLSGEDAGLFTASRRGVVVDGEEHDE